MIPLPISLFAKTLSTKGYEKPFLPARIGFDLFLMEEEI